MASHHYAQGTLIWMKHDEEVWIQGEIVSANEKEIICKTDEDPDARILLGPHEPIFLRTSDVFTAEGITVLDDLTQLMYLHEPAVLSSLQNRFDIDKIYTFTGPILIAVNPFKLIRNLYDDSILKTFITTKGDKAPLKPHVFSTSNAAYRGICDRQKCQTVLISGESGAGKTETTKHVMKFLAVAGAGSGAVSTIEQQVLESNPLLEAFGNARTLRNDNSSRFGKFIEIQFQGKMRDVKEKDNTGVANEGDADDTGGRLCGARIQTYLLEKVRVGEHQEGERNYHVFYQGCAAACRMAQGNTIYTFPQILAKEKVGFEMDLDLEGFSDLSKFIYLTRSTCKTLKDTDDAEMFERLVFAMHTVGISHGDMNAIFMVVAAVLHLGNTKFDAPSNNSEGSQVMAECNYNFDLACKLLGVTRKDLESALCNQTRATKTERIKSPINVRQASDYRDSLARALYGLVFLRIVECTNESIGYRTDVKLFCGVLDIFGFECFKMNSFEQVCINFTNERLQQFFNQFVFKLEEQLYEREGIPWDALDFPDNADAVEILQAKGTGIFSMLDEECLVPAGTDQGFVNKLMRQHKGHRRFDEIKTKPSWFIVKHFAGPVSYCSDGFLDKNKDQLSGDIIHAMCGSVKEFVQGIFKNNPVYGAEEANYMATASGGAPEKKKKKYTVSSEFKDQLASLMDIVDTTEPHFIRCIKPNPLNEPDRYDRKGVTEQLRYGGVLQVVQVSRAGYPVRINHQDCWDDYKVVAQPDVVSGLKHIDDLKLRAQKLLEHLNTELNIPASKHGVSWAVGKSLVFFKQDAFERLKFARLDLLIKSTTLIQASWRRKIKQHMYKAIQIFTKHVQALLQGKKARMDFIKRRREHAATKIQSLARKQAQRKTFFILVKKIVRIQAARRAQLGRKQAGEYKKFCSARKIQRQFRRKREERFYRALRASILFAQQRWRLHAAKSTFKKLKNEAKEVGALVAKNQKSQEQLSDLRKKNEELEAHQFHVNAEKEALQKKVEMLQASVEELQQTVQDVKAKAAEEAASAPTVLADGHLAPPENAARVIVGSDALTSLQQKAAESEGELETLRQELAAVKESFAKKEQAAQDSEARYQQLLKSTAMQSMANLGGGAAPAAVARTGSSIGNLAAGQRSTQGKTASNRNVDIQLVGAQGVGKTSLLEVLINDHDKTQLQRLQEQKTNMSLMSHYQIQIGDRSLRLLDCSGNSRAQHLVKEWFGRSHWVFVIYDMSNQASLTYAQDVLKEVVAAGARVVLFGNKHPVESGGREVQVDLLAAKDSAAHNEAWAIESTTLIDAVRTIISAIDADASAGEAGGEPGLDGVSAADAARGRSSITAAIDSVKSWFGGTADRTGRGSANQGVLRPSLKGTKALKQARREGDAVSDLRPVQELQDSESAVTCICFGQERLHKAYVLLATASKDGTVVIYRCYRTEMEIAMLSDQDFPQDDDASFNTPPADHSNIAVHSRLVGHSRAITSIFFNLLEDQLVTTSIDKSVRFWGVDSGEMLKVFTDSSPVPVAAFLPFNPQVFVAANSNAVLRLVNVQNGMVLQKLKVETEVRALKFDDTGLFLLAGTKNGSIHVLEASDSSTLKFKFKVQLARGGVTCITFVPASYGQPACLLVNTSDSSATIIDCTYGPPAGVLTNLAVRHRVRVAHSLLPLKCCYSPSGQGYLISGSEDKEVYIYSLAKGTNYKMHYLKHHQVPVVAVTVNLQDTLLASADSLGRIVLWRRMDFSHLPDAAAP